MFRKKLFISMSLLLTCAAGQAQVSLSEAGLSSQKVYTLTTSRGGWVADNQFKSTKDANTSPSVSAPNQQFAFVTNPTDTTIVYLYSVGQKKFVKKDRSLTTGNPDPIYIFKTDDANYPLFFTFTQDKSNFNINIGGANQMTVDTYNKYDAGNKTKANDAENATYSLEEARSILTSFSVSGGTQGYQTTGMGNETWLVRAKLNGKATEDVNISKVKVSLKGETASLVDAVNIYVTPTDTSNFYLFDAAKLKPIASSATPAASMDIEIPGGVTIPKGGERYIFVTAKVKENAEFGKTVDASLDGITTADSTMTLAIDPDGDAKIFKIQSMVFPWYSFGTQKYRIPAMIQANNGTIIAISDDRRNHGADAGSGPDDLVYRLSKDNGKTWGERHMLAHASGTRGDGSVYSFGDASIGKTKSGKIIVLTCATDKGFFQGQTSPYIFTSSDNGETWDSGRTINTPETFTDKVSGTKGVSIFSFFCTSGRFITTNTGRLMVACPVIPRSGAGTQNNLLYSDDDGATWTLDNAIIWPSGGNETKLVQRKDHSILASIRQGPRRGFNIGSPDGLTWLGNTRNETLPDPGVDEDIIAYGDSTMLIHTSNTAGRRANLHLYTSHDQGDTWTDRLTIQVGDAAYSTMEVLQNGDLAIFYEDGTVDGHTYDMNYVVVPKEVVEGWVAAGTPKATAWNEKVSGTYGKWFTSSDDGYFSLASADRAKLQPVYDAIKDNCSPTQFFAFRDSIAKASFNMPATGYYRLYNAERVNDGKYGYLINNAGTLANAVNDTKQATTVVKLTRGDDDTYTIQLEGQYVQAPTRSKQVGLGDTPVKFKAIVNEPGKVALQGNTSDGYSSLHTGSQQNYQIVGWTTDAGASQWKVEDADSVVVPATVVGGKSYAAAYLPFAYTTPKDAKAVNVGLSADGNKAVTASELITVPEGYPVLLVGNGNATSFKVAVSKDSEASATPGIMAGGYLRNDSITGALIFGANDGKAGFYKANSVAANTAYIPGSAYTGSGNGLELDLDQTTGISTVDVDTPKADTPAYNLQGQQVGNDYKGIVVMKGKKTLKK